MRDFKISEMVIWAFTILVLLTLQPAIIHRFPKSALAGAEIKSIQDIEDKLLKYDREHPASDTEGFENKTIQDFVAMEILTAEDASLLERFHVRFFGYNPNDGFDDEKVFEFTYTIPAGPHPGFIENSDVGYTISVHKYNNLTITPIRDEHQLLTYRQPKPFSKTEHGIEAALAAIRVLAVTLAVAVYIAAYTVTLRANTRKLAHSTQERDKRTIRLYSLLEPFNVRRGRNAILGAIAFAALIFAILRLWEASSSPKVMIYEAHDLEWR